MKNIKHIYVCSPSASFHPDQFGGLTKILHRVKEAGFSVTLSRHCLDTYGNTSGSIRDRVKDIEEGFFNNKYDLVMASRGGWNSNELLPHLNYKLIASCPKPFVGMSDMTTLCVNLYQRSRTPAFYGMMLLHFGLNRDGKAFNQLSCVLQNPDCFRADFDQMIHSAQILRGGVLEGKLLGGNLAVVCWLLGTEFTLTVDERTVLFLEDDEETNGYYWQMYLNHLRQAEVFEKVRGVIFGQVSPETKFEKGAPFEQIVESVLGEYQFPIVVNAAFGHTLTPITIPYGYEIKTRV